MFSNTVLGNVDECRTECEISDDTGNTVAIVYDALDGWHVDVLMAPKHERLAAFNDSVEAAKQSLLHYVNRVGSNPPQGTTAAGLSLWLMQKDDGTAPGIDLSNQNSAPALILANLSHALADRIRSISRSGHQLEAIRELRIATGCSLEDAKTWLKHNC